MRVKIGDTWYDSEYDPICIQVNETEQRQIAEMAGPEKKYAVFPEGYINTEAMYDWMKG